MKLNQILLSIYPYLDASCHSIQIDDVCTDTRKVTENSLFLLTKGDHFDPHTKINELKDFVSFFIAEHEIDTDVPHLVDPDLKKNIGRIFSNFLGQPEQKMEHIGITGTNGKTSIASILQFIFKDVQRTSYIGTLGIQIDEQPVEFSFDTSTTPQANDLARIIQHFSDENVLLNVMEVSSHSLDQNRAAFVPFKFGIFSNLTIDHLDYHGTFEEYLKAKKRLFDGLTPDSFAVMNADDPHWERMAADSSAKILTYSIHQKSDVQATDIVLTESGTSFNVSYQGKSVPFQTKLIGHFNIYNLLSTIAVSLTKQLTLSFIQEKIASFEGVPGRLEKIKASNRNVFVDYAHTPDGLKSVLEALNELKGSNSIITVFGCGGDRDSSKRPMMGKIADELSTISIVTSDNPRTEDPEKILDDVISGISGAFHRVSDREQAIALAINLAEPNDMILIAGKGHEDYQIIGKTKFDFDDRKIASRLLNSLCS